MKFRFLIGPVGVVLMTLVLMSQRVNSAPPFKVHPELTRGGHAIFVGVTGDKRQLLWTVHCAQPLRACTAKAKGVAVRIDERGRPWLITAKTPGAGVTLTGKRQSQEMNSLLSHPLTAEAIAFLATQEARIVIEQGGRSKQEIPTTGLDHVVDYLIWLKSHSARSLRDARLWPGGGIRDA